MSKVEVLVTGNLPAKAGEALADLFAVRRANDDLAAVRGFARGPSSRGDAPLLGRMPKLEIVASFGVGYDEVDVNHAAGRGIVVTNTPDVLTEEVADTALALLLMTVRELSAAERYLRAGKWLTAPYPLTATLRDRTVGIVGLGRIGTALARRLDAMQVPIVYHTRHARPDVAYRHYPDLLAMARDVDTLIVIVPGTPETRHLIDAHVLRALGSNGVLVNIGRGTTIGDQALVAALKDGTIRAAGLDVFVDEPNVPAELMALPNAVLLPHVGSATEHTRNAMGQLVVDNLWNWFDRRAPLTPVPETPWPRGG